MERGDTVDKNKDLVGKDNYDYMAQQEKARHRHARRGGRASCSEKFLAINSVGHKHQ